MYVMYYMYIEYPHAIPSDVQYFKRLTPLVPPNLLPYVTKANLFQIVRKKLDFSKKRVNNEIEPFATGSIYEYLDSLPFRTKMDKNIRRTSIRPIYETVKTNPSLLDFISHTRLDQISISNHLLWHHITNFEYLNAFISLDAYASIEWFNDIATVITSVVKRYPCDPDLRVKFAEMGSLTGYRNPPMAGFDFNEKVRELANAGFEHGDFDWDSVWDEALKEELQTMVVKPVEPMTFLEFIRSEKANTAGASTFGRVNYDIDGEKDSFKARKNFILDICTPEELELLCKQHAGHAVQKPFVKPELGKLRIAVTGDVYNYFIQAYVMYFVNHAYTYPDWNSLEEDGTEELTRLYNICKELAKRFSIPWDFDKFDHQPKGREVVSIVVGLCFLAIANGSSTDLDWACASFIKSTELSHVVWTFDGIKYDIVTEDGVQSGVRATTVLGNVWNATVTRIVQKLVAQLTMHLEKKYIRGDDSANIANDYYTCLFMFWGYQSLNVKGNPQKFGILYENTEFLRVWYDKNRTYGYISRSIPGIVQRKPWTSEPTDITFGNIRQAIESVKITERRLGYELTELRHQLAIEWSKRNHLSYILLKTPRIYGGPGILPCTGLIMRLKEAKVDLNKPKIHFDVPETTKYRYANEFAKFNVTDDELKIIQQERMYSRTVADDVPAIISKFKTYQKALLRQSLYKVEHLEYIEVIPYIPVLSDPETYKIHLRTHPTTFGLFRKFQQDFRAIQTIARIRDIRLSTMLKTYNNSFLNALRDVEYRFKCHRTVAIDWLFGKLSSVYIDDINPKFADSVSITIINGLHSAKNRTEFNNAFTVLNTFAIESVKQTSFYLMVGRH